MKPWQFGNTTVRSPFRLRDGLLALSTSSLQGKMRGRDQEILLRDFLGENGIVSLGVDTTVSVGRKWRSALNKLGFLYPEVPARSGVTQLDVGPVDTITPNGWRLIRAESVAAMQECFLRALAAIYLPCAGDTGPGATLFSPLRHTLAIMLELENRTGESRLNFVEMALVVQLSDGQRSAAELAARVLDLRARRLAADNKRRFDREEREAVLRPHQYAETTLNDYADTNFRYLKATGLVQNQGRGISLVSEKHLFIHHLVNDGRHEAELSSDYYRTLCQGASLPTDSQQPALDVLNELLGQLQERGISFSVGSRPLESPADIEVVRHEIEDLLRRANEEAYAARQAAQWPEIAAYMELLATRKNRMTLGDDQTIEVPKAEAPAYFEWVLWRAFLAFGASKNPPYEARRFGVDQDFLPVGTAPGNGPDLIFEFQEFVLVVEVTLTDNSRQEAAEGEPVRRHVANLVNDYQRLSGKAVYGLFIANTIDSNTAETFRKAVWYARDDERLTLDIVPMTLTAFRTLFHAWFSAGQVDAGLVRGLLDRCIAIRDENDGPGWKQAISRIVDVAVEELAVEA